MEQSYKEKYEKALEKIKNLIDKDHNDINVDDILNVFPELAESEDEKVRKEIIELVMQPIWKTEKEFHRRNELCAWLKKQGQVKESTISQHENRTCEENGNSLTYKGEGIRKEIINYFRCQSEEEPTRKEIHNKWIAWLENIPVIIDHEKREGFHLGYKAGLEKQGEQKFEMKTAEESLGIDSDTYNKIVDECIFGEQKPQRMISAEAKEAMYDKPAAWSEEDEKNLRRAIRATKVVYPVAADWLKSLKGRVHPKQEWSAEDKYMYDILCGTIESTDINENTKYKLITWLKSLRPQNRWKPSDEQMGCLSDAIEHYNSLGYPASKLKELLDDLKKLKEGKV